MVKDKQIAFNRYLNNLNSNWIKFLITVFLAVWISRDLKSQSVNFQSVDRLVKSIDSDSTLISQKITLDTTYMTDEKYELGIIDTFFVYKNKNTKEIKKIVWNRINGEYYNYFSLYIQNSKAIRGNLKCHYKADDTGSECVTNTVFYLKSKKIVYSKELTPSKCNDNYFWYLYWLNERLKLSGIKIK